MRGTRACPSIPAQPEPTNTPQCPQELPDDSRKGTEESSRGGASPPSSEAGSSSVAWCPDLKKLETSPSRFFFLTGFSAKHLAAHKASPASSPLISGPGGGGRGVRKAIRSNGGREHPPSPSAHCVPGPVLSAEGGTRVRKPGCTHQWGGPIDDA